MYTMSYGFVLLSLPIVLDSSRPVCMFMPPTSEEVEGAYWFGSVRPVVCSQSVMRE